MAEVLTGALAILIVALPFVYAWSKERGRDNLIRLEADLRRRGVGLQRRVDPDGTVYYTGKAWSTNKVVTTEDGR